MPEKSPSGVRCWELLKWGRCCSSQGSSLPRGAGGCLSSLPLPSQLKPDPGSFHCTAESKFAVISVQVIKGNVNLASEQLEGKQRRTTRRAGGV